MNIITSGVVKAFRTAGQSLDNVGKLFEVFPYEDKCEHIIMINSSVALPLFYYLFIFKLN